MLVCGIYHKYAGYLVRLYIHIILYCILYLSTILSLVLFVHTFVFPVLIQEFRIG